MFQSYLEERKQYVKYKGVETELFDCTSGVRQGSLLFLLFINDVTFCIRKSFILLYADDLKVYLPIKTNKDAENLQTDINALVEWSEMNPLPFNIPKCGKITYTQKIMRTTNTVYMMRGEIIKELVGKRHRNDYG